MKPIKLFLVLGFCLLAAQVQADPVLRTLPVPRDLVAFVAIHSGAKFSPAPQITFVDDGADFLRHEDRATPGLIYIAAGAEEQGVIYLPMSAAAHLGDSATRALIVHELVHLAQEKSPHIYACAGQREAEAYQLQNLFLLLSGLPTAVGGDMIAAMRSCAAVGGMD